MIKLVKFGVFLLACTVALELVLQVAAFTVSIVVGPDDRDAGAPAPEDRLRVVCVGDSYTFGLGATDSARSYPGALQTVLAERGLDVAVSNQGVPGQCSRDVLLRMESQLASRPDFVCVLIGTNDGWQHPEQVPLEALGASQRAAETRFVWRWRTGRLIDWLFRTKKGDWTATGAAVGAPAAGGSDVDRSRRDARLVGAGRLLTAAGVELEAPERGLGPPPAEGALRSRLDAVWTAIGAGELDAACDLLATLREEHPRAVSVLGPSVTTLVRAARRDRAIEVLSELRAAHAEAPSPRSYDWLVQGMFAVGQHADAMALARECVAVEPRSITGWDVLQRTAFVLGEWDEVRRASPVLLRLLGASRPALSGQAARRYATAVGGSEPATAARLLLAATLLDADDGGMARTRIVMRKVRGSVPRSSMAAAVAELAMPDDELVRQFSELADEVYGRREDEGWRSVLRNHLVAIGRGVQQRGARVILVSYPFYQSAVEIEQRAAAEELGAPFVAVRERFDRELETRQRAELFVPDGHCNDAGYAIVAELVAERILAELDRQ